MLVFFVRRTVMKLEHVTEHIILWWKGCKHDTEFYLVPFAERHTGGSRS